MRQLAARAASGCVIIDNLVNGKREQRGGRVCRDSASRCSSADIRDLRRAGPALPRGAGASITWRASACGTRCIRRWRTTRSTRTATLRLLAACRERPACRDSSTCRARRCTAGGGAPMTEEHHPTFPAPSTAPRSWPASATRAPTTTPTATRRSSCGRSTPTGRAAPRRRQRRGLSRSSCCAAWPGGRWSSSATARRRATSPTSSDTAARHPAGGRRPSAVGQTINLGSGARGDDQRTGRAGRSASPGAPMRSCSTTARPGDVLRLYADMSHAARACLGSAAGRAAETACGGCSTGTGHSPDAGGAAAAGDRPQLGGAAERGAREPPSPSTFRSRGRGSTSARPTRRAAPSCRAG